MNTAIIWFRKIIRIHDNPMLTWAESSQEIDSIIPIYIIDEKWSLNHENNIGVNRLNFLYDSLLDLDKNLKEIGKLNIRGRMPEGEVPSAKALLVNSTSIDLLTKGNYSHYDFLGAPRKS